MTLKKIKMEMVTFNGITSDANGYTSSEAREFNSLEVSKACNLLGCERDNVHVVWGSLGGNATSRTHKGVYVVRKSDFPEAETIAADKGCDPSSPYGKKPLERFLFVGWDENGKFVKFA